MTASLRSCSVKRSLLRLDSAALDDLLVDLALELIAQILEPPILPPQGVATAVVSCSGGNSYKTYCLYVVFSNREVF